MSKAQEWIWSVRKAIYAWLPQKHNEYEQSLESTTLPRAAAAAAGRSPSSLTLHLLQGKVSPDLHVSPTPRSNALQRICAPQITDAGSSDAHCRGQLQELCWSLVNVPSRDNSKIPGFWVPPGRKEPSWWDSILEMRNEVSQWLEQKGEKTATHSPVSKMWITTLQESTPRSTSPGSIPLLKTDCLADS